VFKGNQFQNKKIQTGTGQVLFIKEEFMQESDTPQKKREGWNAEKISEEASNRMPDEIHREMARGDETKGDADERDTVGSSASIDTPQGREEAKTRAEGGTS
jgi:hypothetical protein